MNVLANSLSGELNAYDRAPEGTRWPTSLTRVNEGRQHRYHQILMIDGAKFSALADISLFAQDVALVIDKSGLPNNGRILLSQRIFQTGYVRLGEELSVEAEVGSDGEGSLGRYLTCNVGFRRANRAVALRLVTQFLLPFAKAPILPQSADTHPNPAQDMEVVGYLQLTPRKVADFAQEAGNLLHSDPAFARSRGFQAPIAQGWMLLTALHSAVVKNGMPWEMDLQAHFVRPVLWDSKLTLYVNPVRRLYWCVNEDGQLIAEAALNHLTIRDMEP